MTLRRLRVPVGTGELLVVFGALYIALFGLQSKETNTWKVSFAVETQKAA